MIATFINITDDNVSTTLGYVKDMITDLTPLMLPVIAILLGLIVFSVIIRAIRG